MMVRAGILCCAALACSGAAPSPSLIRSAAGRAISRLQASQKSWYSEQNCDSCHHQFLPALAYRDARRQGIAVDEKIAHADAVKAFGFYADLDRAVEHAHLVDPGIGDEYSLLAADAAGVRPSVVTAVYARFLAQRQKPDGHWNTFDERPPQSYSVITSTALAIRAIDIYSHPSLRAETRERIERARRWLLSQTPRDTEERTLQLLGLQWSGADATSVKTLAKGLEGLQQPDGGWGSLDGRGSDAYSTGEALVALHDAGSATLGDPAWSRGIEFLLKTEARSARDARSTGITDGTWHVPSRLYPPAPLSPDYFESGYPYGHDQMISALGASWAIMAFARALAPAEKPARQADLPTLSEASPAGIEPWVETVLFGGVEDLRHLLDSGFDPNSATKGGAALGGALNTTALMLAAPDVDKLNLLLDRGAKMNTRTTDGYSALMMAALYSNSAQAIRLLIDRGAEVQLPKDADDPLFHASPLLLAAVAGNAEAVTLLHQAGVGANDSYVYAGIQPGSPLLLISTFDDIAVARALLDAGAAVDQIDTDGLTALQWATLANKTAMVQILIEHGADVNHVDKHGMTPLLYAASIDFGDSAMIELLLRHGARTDARSPEGLTALDLARKYKHTHLLKTLGQAF
jgi:ankyrin repeat protein